MLCVEDFTVNIDVEHVVEFYASFENNLIAKLRAQFDGMCYMGHLILRVDRILRAGECQFVSPTKPTVGMLAVMFRAIVANCAPGDTLSVTIGNFSDSSRILSKSKYVSALFINGDSSSSGLTESDPARAGSDDAMGAIERGAVVYATIIDCGSNPGYDSIAAHVSLRRQTNGVGARCYPIVRGSIARAFESDALTRARYVAEPSSADAMPIQSVARIIRERIARADASRAKDQMKHNVDMIARTLLQKGTRAAVEAPSGSASGTVEASSEKIVDGIEMLDLIEMRAVTAGATHLIVFDSINPLDAKIGVAMNKSALHETWRTDDLARDCGPLIAFLLERYITTATAYENMVNELADRSKLQASRGVMRALSSAPSATSSS
jgi:hypothetical protein